MWDFLKNNLLWTQGASILWWLAICAGASLFIYPRFLFVLTAFFVFSFYFFRNPERICPEALRDATVLICPADGKVVDIQKDEHNGLEGYAQKVSIFLSPLDVHVNRVPFTGVVKKINYKPGTFKLAFLPKSSEFNEHNDVVFLHPNGSDILVRQIAGTVARRICCWVTQDEQVLAGNTFGMIRFGSRVDILLPASINLAMSVGQHVYGGQTVLGRWQ
ncbi:MAG: phosphatidylserine decarboxylase [bacterium]|nr:phosphatidylserine decarboxylase [bacterium]